MIKYTPKPWRHREQVTANGSFFRVEGETVKVANVVTRDYDTALANAKLIAAAPEMLEVLKELSVAVKFRYNIDKEVENAFKVIKKATE